MVEEVKAFKTKGGKVFINQSIAELAEYEEVKERFTEALCKELGIVLDTRTKQMASDIFERASAVIFLIESYKQ
jgi:hypothetical protein